MRADHELEAAIRAARLATDPEVDRQILARLLAARAEARPGRTRRPGPATLALAAGAALALALALVVTRTSSRAWALEDAAAAVRAFGAVHVVAGTPGGDVELWARANPSRTASTDARVQTAAGAIAWTRGGSTWHLEPGSGALRVEPARTVGMTPWLGPELLELLGRSEGAELVRGREADTGQERVTLTGSLFDATGPQSWVITFDAATRLPVSFRVWRNVDRRGPPAFDARRITFLEHLPDELFEPPLPQAGAVHDLPLTIPEAALGALAGVEDGLAAADDPPERAAQRLLHRAYRALLDRDVREFRRLVPLSRGWGDDFLRAMLFEPASAHQRVLEVLEVGPVLRRGHTPLGPIVSVPVVTRRADGARVRDRMIVLFREGPGPGTCVVFGPDGLPEDLP